MKEIELNEKRFWKDLGIDKPSNNLDENLNKFYNKYNKVIKNFIGGNNRFAIIRALKTESAKNPKIIFKIFLSYLESKLKAPGFYETKVTNLNLVNLPYYERAIFRRLRKRDRTIKDPYIRPKNYPSFHYFEDLGKAYIIFKKFSNRTERRGIQRDYYRSFIEKIVIIIRKSDHWLIRTTFSNKSEKNVIKKVLKMNKIIYCEEGYLRNLYEKILEKAKILEISGGSQYNDSLFNYHLNSDSNENLNDFLLEDKTIINDDSIHHLKKIRFELLTKIIELNIVPYDLNLKHIVLRTSNLRYNQIIEVKEVLQNKLGLPEDTYLFSPPEKEKMIYFVLRNKKIERPYLDIVLKIVYELKNDKLIKVNFNSPYKFCSNKECDSHNSLIEMSQENCPDCQEALSESGSYARISYNYPGAKKWLLENLSKKGFNNYGKITKSFNRIKIDFHKFSYKDKEFLIYFQKNEKRNLKDLSKRFRERGLPVLFITTKNDSLEIPELNYDSVGRLKFTDLIVDLEIKSQEKLKENLDSLYIRFDTWKNENFRDSVTLLSRFINNNKDLELIERGTTMTSKGRAFERIVNNILKRLSSSWIDLGQTQQNKSVPDGVGGFSFNGRSFIFGFDAKLKKDRTRRIGLTPTDIKNQVKYIKDFKSQAKKYGGLKSWIIVVKSKDDYEGFKNSIKKIEKESKFRKIMVLGVEHLLKVCELYTESVSNNLNPEVFFSFLHEVLNRKGVINETRFERLYSECKSKLKELKLKN